MVQIPTLIIEPFMFSPIEIRILIVYMDLGRLSEVAKPHKIQLYDANQQNNPFIHVAISFITPFIFGNYKVLHATLGAEINWHQG